MSGSKHSIPADIVGSARIGYDLFHGRRTGGKPAPPDVPSTCYGRGMPSKVTDVVHAAMAALPDFLGGVKVEGLRVEEVEPPEYGSEWRVTLSYLAHGPALTGALAVLQGLNQSRPLERVLRVIVIDSETLEAKKMKIRE